MISLLLLLSGIVAIAAATGQHARHIGVLSRFRFGSRAEARERRLALPGLVESVGSALGSGLSLSLALTEVAPTLPRSLAAPTERAAAILSLGGSIEDAITSYADVVPPEDVAPFSIVLAAFARSGGRIERSLARVASLLRGRLALEEERAALTAQGRVSAIVLIALAPLGAAFFAIMTPEYVAAMFGRGRGLLALALALEIAGAFWLWRILRLSRSAGDVATLLDAVIVGLDAGLTFELALAALVARAPTVARLPEARHLLADLALGRGASIAFTTFGSAGPTEARIAALVRAASRFGSPLAGLLVTQADALRATDRRRAEAQARRLPILMLFPLAFCVLPALLCVFLGPPLLSLLG